MTDYLGDPTAGRLVISGVGNTSVSLTAALPTGVVITLDTNGDGTPESQQTLTWAQLDALWSGPLSEPIDRRDGAVAEASEVVDLVVVGAAVEHSQACGQRPVGVEPIAHLRREVEGSALG